MEIGARIGEGQLASRHRDTFLAKSKDTSYLGIDLLPKPKECLLNINQIDFYDLDDEVRFDTILALEVVEHLCLRDWSRFFERIKSMLNPDGYAFITTPYNEPTEKIVEYLDSFDTEAFGGHVTYGITPKVVEAWFQGAEFSRKRHRIYWREDGASRLRAFARLVKRIITRHPYAWGWTGLKASSLIVLWNKEDV